MMKKQYLTDLIGNHYVDSILVVQLLSDNHPYSPSLSSFDALINPLT